MTDDEQRRETIEALANTSLPVLETIVVPDLPDLPDTKDMKELCKSVQHISFETYYELMTSTEVPPTVRLAAANAITDRGLGKPEQAVTQTVTIERPEVGINEVARMMLFAMRDKEEKEALEDKSIIDVAPEKEDTETHDRED
jgi:hypothetical protein